MILREELKGLEIHIENYHKGYGISNREALISIAEVWARFADENSQTIYGSASFTPPKVDLACTSCVHDMMVMIKNWLTIQGREASTYYKAVTEPHKITVINPEPSEEDKIADLQKRCKERGIKFHHKAGIKKLTELLGE